jgi:hypothetical protein
VGDVGGFGRPFFVRGTGADLVASGAAQSRHCDQQTSAAPVTTLGPLLLFRDCANL